MKRFRVFAIALLAAIAVVTASIQPQASKAKADARPPVCGDLSKGHTVPGEHFVCEDGMVIWQSSDHVFKNNSLTVCPYDNAPLYYGHITSGGQ